MLLNNKINNNKNKLKKKFKELIIFIYFIIF